MEGGIFFKINKRDSMFIREIRVVSSELCLQNKSIVLKLVTKSLTDTHISLIMIIADFWEKMCFAKFALPRLGVLLHLYWLYFL